MCNQDEKFILKFGQYWFIMNQVIKKKKLVAYIWVLKLLYIIHIIFYEYEFEIHYIF